MAGCVGVRIGCGVKISLWMRRMENKSAIEESIAIDGI